MKIYLEYVFIENLIVNYVIVNQISIFTKIKISKINKFFSIFILSFYTVVEIVLKDNIISNILIKILVVNVSIYIGFRSKNLGVYLKEIVYYYIISFTYVGIIISITLLFNIPIEKTYIKILIYIVSYAILYVFNNFLWKLWKTDIKKNDLTYKININGHEIQAFVDTGNTVKDYINNLDVIFIEKKWYEIFKKENLFISKEKININTINSNNEVYGYVIKNIEIFKQNETFYFEKMVFVFVDHNINKSLDCTAIIGYDTYVEKLKGVSL